MVRWSPEFDESVAPQEIADLRPLLDVVREVEVSVVDKVAVGRRCGLRAQSGRRGERRDEAGDHPPPRRAGAPARGLVSGSACVFVCHGSFDPQKFSSRFVWKTEPLPPTG